MYAGEPCRKWGIELLCICNSYMCLCRSVSLPPGITLCSMVSLHSLINHDTSAATLSEAATTRGWLMLARKRLCPYYWRRSASCRCCLRESSSAQQCRYTHTLVNLLLSASDYISTSWSHTHAAVDCNPERYRQNRNSTRHCTIICLASCLAINCSCTISVFMLHWKISLLFV